MNFFTTLLLMATMMRTTPTSLPNSFHFSNHSHDVIDHSSVLLEDNEEDQLDPGLPSYANADHFKFVSNSNYFSSLFFNFDYNYNVLCNFIALSMVLSYYDTYLDDNIIPEGYDVPGFVTHISQVESVVEYIETDDYGSPGTGASYGYTNLVQQRQNAYNPNNFIEFLHNCTSNDPIGGSTSTFAAAFSEGLTRLGTYDCLEYETYFSETYQSEEEFATEISQKMYEGYTVVAEIGFFNRHTVVGCFTDGNTFYYNNGYSKRNPNSNIPAFGQCSFGNIYAAYAIKPVEGTPHVCSDNYILPDGSSICPCMLQGYNYDEEHSHTFSAINDFHHLETCQNTLDTREVPHTFSSPTNPTSTHHSLECVHCSRVVNENHTIDQYTSNGYYTHTVTFEDGCQLVEEHFIDDIICMGGDVHRYSCPCGAWDIGHHFVAVEFADDIHGCTISGIYFPNQTKAYFGIEDTGPGWTCMCGFSNTLNISYESERAIVEFFLEQMEEFL